jgi:protein SCO1
MAETRVHCATHFSIESPNPALFPPLPPFPSRSKQPDPANATARGVARLRRAMHGAALKAALVATVGTAALLTGCTHSGAPWQLTDVTGHLPDLDFTLTGDDGRPVNGESFRGRTSLVYFGYTHCPDVCPETMARLMQVLDKLGPDARNVRILFITVDPARDTPKALHDYVGAFDAQHAEGLTGTDWQIESLAKRYRVAYQMEKRDPDGNYDVTHSSAVYVFDPQGHARLLATEHDTPDQIAQDLRRVIDTPS